MTLGAAEDAWHSLVHTHRLSVTYVLIRSSLSPRKVLERIRTLNNYVPAKDGLVCTITSRQFAVDYHGVCTIVRAL